jgi:hypothetical protein
MTPEDDRLVAEAMASQIDIHHVNLTDEIEVAQCLMRAGWRAELINRLMDRAVARTCELRTLRTILAPAIVAEPKPVIERHPITDKASWLELRKRDVTGSHLAALVGAHEYKTALELWHHHIGSVPLSNDETPAMERGALLRGRGDPADREAASRVARDGARRLPARPGAPDRRHARLPRRD